MEKPDPVFSSAAMKKTGKWPHSADKGL